MWIACQFKQLKGILGISIRPQAHRCMVGIFFCGHHLISTDADVDVGCLASNILANSGRLGLLRPGSFYCARPEKKKQKQKKKQNLEPACMLPCTAAKALNTYPTQRWQACVGVVKPG